MRHIFLFFSLLLSLYCRAGTTTISNGCVKYLATGKVYELPVRIVDGMDLFAKFRWADPTSKYAIVFWKQDEATVIDLGPLGLYMDTGVDGKDLDGRRWLVAKTPWC